MIELNKRETRGQPFIKSDLLIPSSFRSPLLWTHLSLYLSVPSREVIEAISDKTLRSGSPRGLKGRRAKSPIKTTTRRGLSSASAGERDTSLGEAHVRCATGLGDMLSEVG